MTYYLRAEDPESELKGTVAVLVHMENPVVRSNMHVFELVEWLRANTTKEGARFKHANGSTYSYTVRGDTVYFQFEHDALAFKLRFKTQ